MDKKYELLLEKYPETLSLEQLYQICHISKRKAKWLLDNNVIPCRDTGKQTRRYKISKKDVIAYLEKCDAADLTDLAPPGIFSSHWRPKRRMENRAWIDEFLDYLQNEELRAELRAYYEHKFQSYPDGLTTEDIMEMTDHSKNAVNLWIKKGKLKAYYINSMNRIPKTYFLDFLCSTYYIKSVFPTRKQKNDMLSFLDLRKSKHSRK